MNIFKKLFAQTSYLSERTEFNRNNKSGKLNTMFYSSDNTIKKIESDIKKGIGIIKAIDLVFFKGKNCVIEGNHRIAAAKNAKLDNVPVRLILKGKLNKDLKNRYSKFKDI